MLGIALSSDQQWLLGIAGALCAIWIPYRLSLQSTRNARYHTAADHFRKGINALVASAPEPGRAMFLVAYASNPIGEFSKTLEQHADDFSLFLSKRKQAELKCEIDKVIHFARKRPDTTNTMTSRDSEHKIQLKQMIKNLIAFAPEDRPFW